jgi:hypothetical protein
MAGLDETSRDDEDPYTICGAGLVETLSFCQRQKKAIFPPRKVSS